MRREAKVAVLSVAGVEGKHVDGSGTFDGVSPGITLSVASPPFEATANSESSAT